MAVELNWQEKNKTIKAFSQLKITKKVINIPELTVNKNAAIQHHLFEADNLEAMLLNRVKWQQYYELIYIDPPYNTGTTDFIYNDKFSSQNEIDFHSGWLNFMYPRLKLAQEFLNENGAIFISIDDAELYNLKLMCDEIFGAQNFIANLVRKNKSGAGHDSKQIAVEYDYVLCYAKNAKHLTFTKDLAKVETDKKYKFTDEFVKRRGKYYLRDLDYRGSYSKTLDFGLKMPDGSEIFPGGKLGKPNTWRWSKEKIEWGIQHKFVVFKKNGTNWKAYIKQYQFVDNKDQQRTRQLPYRALIDFKNATGSVELRRILNQNIFHYPKPIGLLQFIIKLFNHVPNLKILDFFAGSGTTLHAAMLLNQTDNNKRQVTLITNNENNICLEVTYPRNKLAIEGFKTSTGKMFEPLSKNKLLYYRVA